MLAFLSHLKGLLMKIAGIILLLLSAATFAYWGATGAHFITLYEQPETYTEVDDFGDEVEKTRMVENFQFGLNPSEKYYDGALPIGGTTGGLGLALLIGGIVLGKKKKTA